MTTETEAALNAELRTRTPAETVVRAEMILKNALLIMPAAVSVDTVAGRVFRRKLIEVATLLESIA